MLTEGVKVSYQKEGSQRGDLVWLVDFDNPEKPASYGQRHNTIFIECLVRLQK
jgi:hypothetical protein